MTPKFQSLLWSHSRLSAWPHCSPLVFHPRLQKMQCFPGLSSFMFLYLFTCCSLLCSDILPCWQTLIFQDSTQTMPFSWSLFLFFLYSTEATTHPPLPSLSICKLCGILVSLPYQAIIYLTARTVFRYLYVLI